MDSNSENRNTTNGNSASNDGRPLIFDPAVLQKSREQRISEWFEKREIHYDILVDPECSTVTITTSREITDEEEEELTQLLPADRSYCCIYWRVWRGRRK